MAEQRGKRNRRASKRHKRKWDTGEQKRTFSGGKTPKIAEKRRRKGVED